MQPQAIDGEARRRNVSTVREQLRVLADAENKVLGLQVAAGALVGELQRVRAALAALLPREDGEDE